MNLLGILVYHQIQNPVQLKFWGICWNQRRTTIVTILNKFNINRAVHYKSSFIGIDIPDSYYPIKLESPVRINRYRDWMAESDNNSSIEFLYVDGSAQTIRKQMVSGGSQTKPVLCVPLIRKNPALGSIEIVTAASSVSDFDSASTSSASDGYLTSHEEDKDPKEEECDRNCFRRIKKSAYTLSKFLVQLAWGGN